MGHHLSGAIAQRHDDDYGRTRRQGIRFAGTATRNRYAGWRKFYGASVPSDIASVYELQYSIGKPDPDGIRLWKERLQWENERINRQSNTPSTYEAVLAAEAIAALPKVD